MMRMSSQQYRNKEIRGDKEKQADELQREGKRNKSFFLVNFGIH